MKMNDLLNFRTGNKYLLIEDCACEKLLSIGGMTYDVRNSIKLLPKGLIFTIVTVKMNNQNHEMKCKIIRSKKIVEKIYKPNNIDPNFYTACYYDGRVDKTGYIRFSVSKEKFTTFLNTIKADNFTEEYSRITEQL